MNRNWVKYQEISLSVAKSFASFSPPATSPTSERRSSDSEFPGTTIEGAAWSSAEAFYMDMV